MKKFFSIIYTVIVIAFALTSCGMNNDEKLKKYGYPDIVVEDIVVEDIIVEDIIIEDIIVEDIIIEN